MAGVPHVWETIRKGIISKVNEHGMIATILFNVCLECKWFCLDYGLEFMCPLFDYFMFNKVKVATGGRLKYAIAGGAPTSIETQRFISTVVCPIVQGYGMTETTA